MNEEDRKKIRKIFGTMRCPKNFQCAEGGFTNLCEARDFGDEERLHCLDETVPACPFARLYDCGIQIRFCECPLRVYLAKHLNM